MPLFSLLLDFKLRQIWRFGGDFIAWKTYFALVLEKYTRLEFCLQYTMLHFGVVSPHTVIFEMCPQWLISGLNLFFKKIILP